MAASAAGLSFLVWALARNWAATRAVVADTRPGWLAAGFVLAMAAMVAMALPWRAAQHLVGPALSRFDTVTLYFRGEIGKYVPGALWAVVGRAELATRAGLDRGVAYVGVGLSLAAQFAAAGVVLSVALISDGQFGARLWLLLVIPAGITMVHPRVLRRAWGRFTTAPPRVTALVGLIGRYVPAWVLVASATLCLTRAVAPTAPIRQIVAATVGAWLAGFVAIGAPGGLGVREAVFVAMASRPPEEAALAIALLARLAFVVADTTGAMAATVLRVMRARASA